MPPATRVPISPTISDTRAPKISRLKMSRLWKSVPSGVAKLPPSIQNGGANISAPFTGNVGSYGAMKSAKTRHEAEPAENDDRGQRRFADHLDDRGEPAGRRPARGQARVRR